ncbi:outer membrane beta-barrel family protein [Rufibacter quisquiliarum]|uniref:Outer membrane receptor protein involved in Fe transport n=1 Tax=Rufibacter quisquiliarum TaxID=1549639 RepID=A0A839GQN7_9BACT|nr:outer membrane beta-barrel family protein [Rufibacter quisquiliarum]MBA9076151.1 outer membrane receptor protein involved in Fe transport [Rufibacter quisquiliarum]
MKKRSLFLPGLLCLCLSVLVASLAQAQAPPSNSLSAKGEGKISGLVKDSISGKPVAYATVALMKKNTTQTVDGTRTDGQGQFNFSGVAAGEYTVMCSLLGYAAKTVQSVPVTAQNPTLHLGEIQLTPAVNQLQEVTVVGQKPLIEDKGDRLVYNADQDLTNTGGNAADVLQKVPSLSVDGDGNVQLRGSSNVRVLLNGKASTILATNLADALKQIPSDQIKSVEVMTTPSAKYDAEGTAGIINIITKKNHRQGVSGSAGFTAGTQNNSLFSNTSLRRRQLGINVNLNTFHYAVPRGYGMYRAERTEGVERLTTQTGDGKVYGGGGSAQLGLEYELDSMNFLAAGFQLNLGRYQGNGQQETLSPEPAPLHRISHTSAFEFVPFSTDANLEYTHIFSPRHEFTLLGQLSRFDLDNLVRQEQLNARDQLFYQQHNTNASLNHETTLQADYTHPFSPKTTLEVGAKTIIRRAESNAQYDIRFPLENRAAPEDNIFEYRQHVLAGYATLAFALGKKNHLKAGLRYERTRLNGDFSSTGTFLEETYQNMIPSVTLSRTVKENQTVKLSYTQRIQRPHIFLLNPYRDSRDPKSIFFGNPELEPELTHLYEAGYSTFFKTSSVTTSVYLRQVDNAIQPVTPAIEEGVAQNTYGNAGRLLSYGLNVAGSTKPVPAWNLSGSANVYFNQLQGEGYRNNGWQYNLTLSTGYDLGKGWSSQFSGGFNSARVTLQGHAYATGYHSLAVKKELFQKKGSVTLGLNNPFTAYINSGYALETAAFTQRNENLNYNRAVRLSFDYKFGQADAKKAPRKKKTIRNDDLKQGE